MSARWEQVGLTDSMYKDLASSLGFLDGVADTLDAVAATTNTVAAVASAVDQLLAEDPITAALSVVQSVLDDAITDLAATDVYLFPLLPTGWRALLRPYTTEQALSDLDASFLDGRDPNRPNFTASSGAYASVTFLAGANNWHDFTETIRIFGELFDGTELNRWAKFADLRLKYQDMRDYPIPRPQRYAHGAPWDWRRTNWQTLLPGISDALERLYAFLDSARGYQRGLGQLVADAVMLLKRRIEYIRALAEEVSALANFLARVMDALPRTNVLWASDGSGGIPHFLQTINGAGNRPNHKLVGGVVLMVGTYGPEGSLEVLKRMLGMQEQRLLGQGDNPGRIGQIEQAAQGGNP